jgi:methylglutamate dehydrogenase subunit D
VFERQSALTGISIPPGSDGRGGQRRLRLGEVRGWNLVQVAAFAETMTQLKAAMRSVLGTDLPADLGKVVVAGDWSVLKTGPEQFWIITHGAEDVTSLLRAAVAAPLGAITPLSHSRTRIFIEGSAARELLSAAIAIDLHPDVFRLNGFALTSLHHTPVLILRSGESCYELYVLRTFARWSWEWLIDAALPFGYDIVDARDT